jgi:predicted nucleic acid-binding protein
MRSFVLDASAVVHYLEAGLGSDKFEQLLAGARRQQLLLYMSALNLGEVYYLTWQRAGEEAARHAVVAFSRLPIQIVSVDLAQALKAGELKAAHKIPYADSVAAALALRQQATLVTSDRDFEKLGRHFPILWIARA